MKRERRTLSVPSVSFPDEGNRGPGGSMMDSSGFLGTPPQQGTGASGGTGWAPQQQQPSISSQSLGKPPPNFNRSRSASTSSLSTPTAATPVPGAAVKKKTVTACQRCRTRKIRCDGALPACKSCVKAGVECIEVDRTGDNNMPRSHVLGLENRIKWLEDIVRARAPDVDLQAGPPVELRSRPSPPAIRIVTTGPDFHPPPSSMSSTSSPSFALSPASTCATPASFDFSPVPSPNYLAPVSPYTFSDAASPSPSSAPSSPLLASSPLFQPQDPVSQDVGLLSLSALEEPKYLGSSSGVSFARLVFQDASSGEFRQPDLDQGGRDVKPSLVWPGLDSKPAALPNTDECVTLSSTYFTTVALQYPFLHRQTFDACLEATYHAENGALHHLPPGYTAAVARFHVFMVLSIGANILSGRGRASRSMASDSEGYYASAMQIINDIGITGSLTGVQSALLLAMRSLHASEGLNLWYLNAVIMATCVDLGFQRKIVSYSGQDHAGIKKRIFWCAYAFDRNLGIALGRPFSLRDESFDVEFPEEGDNDEELHHMASLSMGSNMSGSIENARASFSGSICLFRMMKVISGIGTTIYRVSQPHVGRWQVDLPEWQMATYRQLTELRDQWPNGRAQISRSSPTPLQAFSRVPETYRNSLAALFLLVG
ncbi:putative fungal-specific transcription factor [Tuber indicum]|nr:putative fungal-specific transcription factor [Tuber indicum]